MNKTLSLLTCLSIMLLVSCQKNENLVDREEITITNKKSDNNTPCFTLDDRDCDGIGDDVDNCPDTYNPGQEDTNNNGIGDACDSNGGNPGGGAQSNYVSAATYYNNYCMTYGILNFECGLARGIKETLDETNPIFKNTTVFAVVDKYYKINPVSGSTGQATDATYCATNECYKTVGAVEISNDPFLIRYANTNWLAAKTNHIDELKADFPNLSDYYNGYKSGCTQAFWFYNSQEMPAFQIP